ncbi:MAG: cold shock domain-containing protein [Acidobacteriota bacterium]
MAFGLGPKKSYGFIRPDKGQANLFVHVMQLSGGLKTLRPGQRVIYKPSQGQRGPEAVEVRNES